MMSWIGNIYRNFENMIQEVEDTVLEDIQYLENQMSIVEESVKKFYSGAMEDFLPPSTNSAPVLPIGHYARISDKSFQRLRKRILYANMKQLTDDSSVNIDSDYSVKADNFKSGARPQVGSADIESNAGSDVNQQNTEMPASETTIEATVSVIASAEVTAFASVADCCDEIENASTEQNCGVEVLVESADEKEENMSSFSSDIFEDALEFSMIKAMRLDCSDAAIEQDHQIMQQDDESKLEETCVLISKDELPLVSNATVNLKTSEKKWLQPFSLTKKYARKQEYLMSLPSYQLSWINGTRKQEYEELAMLHRKNENDDYIESICPTLLEEIFDPEWELL